MTAKSELAKLGPLSQANPALMKQFAALDAAVMADGALPAKVKELIATAVSLTTQCQYCLEIHSERARHAGATEEELAEATWVAAVVRSGGSLMHAANHVFKGDPTT